MKQDDPLKKDSATRFLLFQGIGAAVSLSGLCLMGLLAMVGVSYTVYTAIGHLLNSAIGFFLHLFITFRNLEVSIRVAMARYFSVYAALLVLVLFGQNVCIEVLRAPQVVGVGLGAILYGILGYLLCRYWIFVPRIS